MKTGSDAGGPKGAPGTSSTERPVTHHLSSTLEGFVGSVGIGDPKTCWLVDSGATCHIVSEKWVKHYTAETMDDYYLLEGVSGATGNASWGYYIPNRVTSKKDNHQHWIFMAHRPCCDFLCCDFLCGHVAAS